MPRHLPPPWKAGKIVGYVVRDANGQSLAYVYSRASETDAIQANVLTDDEARRVATNIARLPQLLIALWQPRVKPYCPLGAPWAVSLARRIAAMYLVAACWMETARLVSETRLCTPKSPPVDSRKNSLDLASTVPDFSSGAIEDAATLSCSMNWIRV
jgi:hypothetical protein